MTSTLSTLRGMLSKEVQSSRYVGLTTTSAGDAGGTTLIDTGLNSLPSGGDNDFCLGMYVLITELVTGGPAVGESQQVTAYVASTSTITTAAFSAQVKTGTNFELHRYDPDDMDTAINNAVELLYPHLHVPYRDETLTVDDLLANSSYESTVASAAHPSWTNSGAGLTVSGEATNVFHGAQAAKLVEAGTGVAYMYQTPTVKIPALAGKTATFKRWVWASAASTARIRIDWDGGTTIINSDYHTGDYTWRKLSVSGVIPATATGISCRCEVATSGTAYFDGGPDTGLFVEPRYRYTIPSSIIKGPYALSVSRYSDVQDGPFDVITDYHVEEDASGRYIMLNDALPSGYILKITGSGPLSTMSTDAGTTQVDAPRTQLVTARAAQWLFEQLAADSPGDGSDFYVSQARRYEQRTERLLATPGMRMRANGATRSMSWSYG